jgi:xylan 1,4-beta-xylosidase
MPTFTCDFSQTPTQFTHFWEHTVGSGHAPLALRADWQTQLQKCHHELGFRHVRFHGILSEPMGTLIRHADGLLYSFFNADQIIDFLLSTGMKPFVELSFMPRAIASGHETVFHYDSNVTPPQDYEQWATLMRKLVQHWVDRYGVEEVGQWFFEVWNEPNIKHFWTGSQAAYFKLYRHTAEAIKGVDPSLQVGGPATAQNEWIEAFLDFCHENGLPVDFVTTHYYPTDAFGKVGTATEEKLAGTSPNVMREQAQEAQRQAGGRPLYYTEWNIASNPRHPLHDQPFAAAFASHIIMSVRDLVQGYSFWTFSDIFEENYFPSLPFHGGFGLLNLHGIPKPVYRAFELLHRLGTELVPVDGSHETAEVWVTRQQDAAVILMVNHAPPRQAIQTELVDIRLTHTPEPRTAYIERIDQDHANPRRRWVEMGEPKYLSPFQVNALQAASRLVKEPLSWQYDEEQIVQLKIDLPPHSVAAVTVELKS